MNSLNTQLYQRQRNYRTFYRGVKKERSLTMKLDTAGKLVKPVPVVITYAVRRPNTDRCTSGFHSPSCDFQRSGMVR